MDVDEELEIMEDDEWTDAEEAEEESDFEDEEEWEDDEFDPDEDEYDPDDEDEYDDEGFDEDENDDEDDDEDEYEPFITREKVAGATNDFNSIYKEGAATARELKDAFDDIKDAFNFKDLFK